MAISTQPELQALLQERIAQYTGSIQEAFNNPLQAVRMMKSGIEVCAQSTQSLNQTVMSEAVNGLCELGVNEAASAFAQVEDIRSQPRKPGMER